MARDLSKITFYGMRQCPGCQDLKKYLEEQGMSYEFRNLADLRTLKSFLELRDTLPDFEEVRQSHRVGIPCIVREDGSVCLDWREEFGLPPEEDDDAPAAPADPTPAPAAAPSPEPVPSGAACSLTDRSGC